MSRVRPRWNPDWTWEHYVDPAVRHGAAPSPELTVSERSDRVVLWAHDGTPLRVHEDRPFRGYRSGQ